MIAGSQKSYRQKQAKPTIPIARSANPTSVWNGLPGGQPIVAATSSAKTVCITTLNMPIAPDTPRHVHEDDFGPTRTIPASGASQVDRRRQADGEDPDVDLPARDGRQTRVIIDR